MNPFRLVCLMLLIVMFGERTPGYAQERQIRPGDILQITIISRPDLSRTVTVRTDGTIPYPFIGTERVVGLSLTQLRLLLISRLSQNLGGERLTVDVAWGETKAKGEEVSVTVLGLVSAPGVFSVSAQSGIQGAINAAGGTKIGAKRREIKLRRTTEDGLVEVIVDFDKFLETGDLGYIPPLQDGDIIIVPGGLTAGGVRVLGAVEKPGLYEPTSGSTVVDMVAQAGGVTKSARTGNVRLVRPSAGQAEEYTINLSDYLKTGKQTDSPVVEPGDLIIVPTKLISYERVLNFARDLTVLFSIYYLFLVITRS